MASYDKHEEPPLDPAAERLRRKLMRLLLVSGGIMALGLIAVFGAIVYRVSDNGASRRLEGFAGEPIAARIPLPGGVRLVSTALDGDRALLQIAAADGSASLLLIDLRSGEVLGRYALAPE